MTTDLDETLSDLGPGFRQVVERLRSAETLTPRPMCVRRRRAFPLSWRRCAAAALNAAALACALSFGFWRCAAPVAVSDSGVRRVYTAAYSADAAAVAAIVASQRADGSWTNDFLTRQNAAALAAATDVGARIAYKKAVRYLRARGLRPLTAKELDARRAAAAARLNV